MDRKNFSIQKEVFVYTGTDMHRNGQEKWISLIGHRYSLNVCCIGILHGPSGTACIGGLKGCPWKNIAPMAFFETSGTRRKNL
jgi:hypothetical protein